MTILQIAAVAVIVAIILIRIWAWRLSVEVSRLLELSTRNLEEAVDSILRTKKREVINSYRLQVSEDSFGVKQYRAFEKSLEGFLHSELKSHIDDFEAYGGSWSTVVRNGFITAVRCDIEELYAKELDRRQKSFKSPREYELFCAAMFQKCGWTAKATKASSDQGVDVVAEKGAIKLVAQCKKYARPVGNKAVQEVVSGMAVYDANVGVVIAPNGFTRSAIELANLNNVHLVHHDQIADL